MKSAGAVVQHALRRLRGRNNPVILMYHRIADVPVDPWKLAVHPDNFAAQMRVLAKHRKPVPLDWMIAELRAGRRHPGTVAITFDDAYRDVLENAKPVLAELNIPATVFVVTGALGKPNGFWWDRLAAAVLSLQTMPESLDLSFLLHGDRDAVEAIRRNGNVAALHMKLWAIVNLLDTVEDREAAVDEAHAKLATADPPPAPVMTPEDLHDLVDGDLITVGAHTVSHPSLPRLTMAEQRAEIGESRQYLETLLGRKIQSLAYPFGDFDSRSEDVARALGFDYAVSTQPGTVKYVGNIFRLARYDMRNWNGHQFKRKLNWFN
jgi:peptidoglycan/xylan/chitin deacetylase (PgdA/CDA1 family)